MDCLTDRERRENEGRKRSRRREERDVGRSQLGTRKEGRKGRSLPKRVK